MTAYVLEHEGQELVIRIIGVDDRKDPLLQAFGQCRDGTCDCPTGEFDKLARIEVISDEEGIVIRLRPKPGESLTDSEIDACVRWTLDRNSGSTPDGDV